MIQKIKNYLEEELSKGNPVYKEIRSFCNKLYRYENKDKVSVWNANYREKLRKLKYNSEYKLNKVDCETSQELNKSIII